MRLIPLDKSTLNLFAGHCYLARREPDPLLLQGTLRRTNLFANKYEHGLNGLLAIDSAGTKGIIEWIPLAESHLGFNLPGTIFLRCIRVECGSEGAGLGNDLMETFLDISARHPIVAFASDRPGSIPRKFLVRYDFSPLDTEEDTYLMFKPGGDRDYEWALSNGPFLIRQADHPPLGRKKQLILYHNDFCQFNWMNLNRILDDVKGRSDVAFRVINCNFRKYPESCMDFPTLFLDGKLISWRPLVKEQVKGLLEKAGL